MDAKTVMSRRARLPAHCGAGCIIMEIILLWRSRFELESVINARLALLKFAGLRGLD